MNLHVLVCFIFASLLLASVVQASSNVRQSKYILGGSGHPNKDSTSAVIASGANHVRVYLLWRYVQPTLSSVDQSLRVAQLRHDPARVAQWAAQQDWRDHDLRCSFYEHTSVQLIGEVGEGTLNGLPRLASGEVFDPNVVGDETYLAYLYLSSRGIVSRYKHKISKWQIENELNEAYLASIGGQRRFQVIESRWSDMAFLTRVLQTLVWAVKDEQPGAIVLQNVHTDVPLWVHDVLLLPGYYEQAVRAWTPLLDMVALDAYPNALVSSPCRSDEVGKRVAAARRATNYTLPVFVMEWNYPLSSTDQRLPPSLADFSDARQVACIRETWDAIRHNNGTGLMFFHFVRATGIRAPPGGYNALDLKMLDILQQVQRDNFNPLPILEWFESGVHLQYLEHRLPLLLKSFEDGGGVLFMNGTRRAGFYELQRIFNKY